MRSLDDKSDELEADTNLFIEDQGHCFYQIYNKTQGVGLFFAPPTNV